MIENISELIKNIEAEKKFIEATSSESPVNLKQLKEKINTSKRIVVKF